MGGVGVKPVSAWAIGLLFALLSTWASATSAQALTLSRLASDPAPAQVLDGSHNDQFRVQPGTTLYEQARQPVWWRITADAPIAADDEPQLVLASPFLGHVEAWVPGNAKPSRHALYGPDADHRYSTRALVIELPQGLPAGASIWLRLQAPASVPMAVSILPRDAVHRADLRYVAWRSVILATLWVLALLAVAFWVGIGDRSFGFLAANLVFAACYLVAMGGEARDIPGVSDWLSATPQAQRMFGCLGIIFSNLFQRVYLDLQRQLPWLDRILLVVTAVVAVLAVASLFTVNAMVAQLGNLGLLVSALVMISASAILTWRGDRSGRMLLLSWLPLIIFSVLRTLELLGWWTGPEWLAHALAVSFAIAGLLLTIGLADKLLELRRDRDRVSAQANIDALTGTLSRPAIERSLRDAIAATRTSRRALCVAFIDIDNFKQINDSHGHQVGDHCLRYISQRVRNRLRARDMLGRYGGDELLVVMPDTARDDAVSQAEHMRAAINCRPLAIDSLLLVSTLSIGLAQWRPDESMAELLARADAALYAGKAAGRDCIRVDNSIIASRKTGT